MKAVYFFPIVLFVTSLAHATPEVTVLAELQQRPGNPTVTPDGTVYFSMHPFDTPEFKVMRLENGEVTPYPNKKISRSMSAVIGIQATQDGTLWWLDIGSDEISPKLIGWDTLKNRLKAIHVIPKEACVSNSFHQDFAIDEKRKKAFIADMSRSGMIDASDPAIVVIDLISGESRRILSGHSVFQPGKSPLIADGKVMQMKDDVGKHHQLKLGLNPIAIDPANDWVYFSTMTPGKLYRVSAAILGDFSQSEEYIEKAIEAYADKPSSDGIAVAENGKVYITNVDDNVISIADASGTRVWSSDERLKWSDGLFLAPDGGIVVTVNQLHRAKAFNDGQSLAVKPYFILKISDQ